MANIYNFADTWDNAAVAWVGVGIDITDSASDAASRLLKLSVNSVETFAVRKDGAVVTGSWQGTAIGPTKGGTGLTSFAAGDIIYASGVNTLAKLSAGTNGHVLTLSSGVPVWAAPGGGASAPLTLAGGTVASNSPPLEITQTWNNNGVTFQGLKINITRTAAAANSPALAVQIGGSNILRVVGSGGAPDNILFGTGTVAGIGEYADHLVFGGTSAFNMALNSSGYGDDKMLKLHQGGSFGWSGVNAAVNTADLRLARSAANVLQIAGASSAPAALFTRRFTVANLPAASSYDGCIAHVSDATVTTPRTTVSGGGSNKVMVMSDGTNWLIAA